MEEIWKPVPGYNGNYEASNTGMIRIIDRFDVITRDGVKDFKPYTRKRSGKVLKNWLDKDGYVCGVICENGKIKNIRVHRLIASTFIDNPDNKPFIDHINTIKNDNRIENLRWCTNSENLLNPLTSQLKSKVSKGVPKIMDRKVLKINPVTSETVEIFHSCSAAARDIRVSQSWMNYTCKKYPRLRSGFYWRFSA